MTMIVTDETVANEPAEEGGEPDGLSVNLFRPNPRDFPDIQRVGLADGDIIQLRHVRVQRYQNHLQAISARWSAWTVFHREESTGQWKCRPEREIGAIEVARLDELEEGLKNLKNLKTGGDGEPQAKRRKRPTLTVAEVVPGTYFDLIAEVKEVMAPPPEPGHRNLILRDYTAHSICGPNLLCTFWDQYADQAARFEPGDLVHVRNLLPKLLDANLVAVLHGDAAGNHVAKLTSSSPLVLELIKRKERWAESEMAAEQEEGVDLGAAIPEPPKPARMMTILEGWKGIPISSIASVLSYPKVR
jgi:hypothetical protein